MILSNYFDLINFHSFYLIFIQVSENAIFIKNFLIEIIM
jgi:hypothetical protein